MPQAAAQRLGLDAELAVTLLRFTLWPMMTRLADELAPLRQGVAWERGDCPTCGNPPLLAELRGLEQKRWLRCGWCASGWEVPRLFCPFCGNRDHASLVKVQADELGGNRFAALCELCQGYVRTTPTLVAPSAIQLLVLDLELLHFDLILRARGTGALLTAPPEL
jgi:FdhE protein